MLARAASSPAQPPPVAPRPRAAARSASAWSPRARALSACANAIRATSTAGRCAARIGSSAAARISASASSARPSRASASARRSRASARWTGGSPVERAAEQLCGALVVARQQREQARVVVGERDELGASASRAASSAWRSLAARASSWRPSRASA